MTLTRIQSALGALLIAASACPKPVPVPPPPPLDAGPIDAGPPPDAGPRSIPSAHLTAVIDAGPAPSPSVVATDAGPVALDGGHQDGGAVMSAPDQQLDLTVPDASVPDSVAILFQADAPLEDARFRLLTEDDRLVPNHADISVTDGGTRVVLTPTPYWPPRACCRFVVDGEAEHFPTGGGNRYLTFEADFSVAADPARLEAAIAAKQRQHRHRRRR
jgi:hypothetical protein